MTGKKTFVLAAILCTLAGGMAVSQEEELKDCPYFTGMSSYEIAHGQNIEFDSRQFFDGKALVTLEGKVWERQYNLKEDAPRASALQIIRNYAAAIRKASGTVFLEGECHGEGCGDMEGNVFLSGRFTKGGREVWVQVLPHDQGEWFQLAVLEKQAMRQEVTANVMLDALNRDGFIALYINFDVNKADIKPDSQPIVEQIALMLKGNLELKVSIEGHTDSSGDAQKNKVLSQQRAEAVKNALVKMGIDAGRLSAYGWGQEKPVADNRTEEGRAKNRRVEIVKK